MRDPDELSADQRRSHGLAWGLLAATIWAHYAVLARLAVKSGLHASDLTLMRFLPGALIMAPFLLRWGWRDLAGIGWRRGLVLTLLAGPGFSLMFMGGLMLAPLAHAAVIAPACQMLAGIGFSALLSGQRWSRETAIGAGFVLIGLLFMGSDGLLQTGSGPIWLGDLMFVAAGCCWGLFGALSRRWQVEPLRLTAVIVVLSFLLFTPPFLLFADLSRLANASPGMWAMQLLAQGVGAGLVALLAYSRAAALLGAGPAGFFGAMVPGAAALLAIPILGEIPTGLQVMGLLTVVLGLLVAFGAAGILLKRLQMSVR